MSKHSQYRFTKTSSMAGCGQSSAEMSFDLRDGALDLPTLSVKLLGKALLHFRSVTPGPDSVFKATMINRDSRVLDAKFFATQCVKIFAVVRAVCRQRPQRQPANGTNHRLTKVTGIVSGTHVHHRRSDQMRGMFADQRQFDPGPVLLQPRRALQKIAADIAAFESRGINGSCALTGQQSLSDCASKNAIQQPLNGPPFKRRCSAFWRVVK